MVMIKRQMEITNKFSFEIHIIVSCFDCLAPAYVRLLIITLYFKALRRFGRKRVIAGYLMFPFFGAILKFYY